MIIVFPDHTHLHFLHVSTYLRLSNHLTSDLASEDTVLKHDCMEHAEIFAFFTFYCNQNQSKNVAKTLNNLFCTVFFLKTSERHNTVATSLRCAALSQTKETTE